MADLSEKTQKILRRIRKKYKVDFQKLKIRDQELEILKVTDLEQLLAGKDPFANVQEFPFWIKLWEASMVLADAMAAMPAKNNETLLELGAGMAAPGLVAAKSGYQVTLSDYEPHILDFQRVSCAANNLTNVDFRMIDWLKPPEMQTFDRIIGAEILFRDDFFAPLLAIFTNYLAPGGEIFLAHDMRRRSVPKFLNLAQDDFNIAVQKRTMKGDEGEITVLVNRLTRR
ncbi:MAG: methyltransferase domain-containing protein [Thermodesulfobacteriota bacterium]